jgi:hypothetical protein
VTARRADAAALPAAAEPAASVELTELVRAVNALRVSWDSSGEILRGEKRSSMAPSAGKPARCDAGGGIGERAARGKMKPHVSSSDKDRWRQLLKLWRVLACGSECGYPHLERRNVIKLESRRHAVPPTRT